MHGWRLAYEPQYRESSATAITISHTRVPSSAPPPSRSARISALGLGAAAIGVAVLVATVRQVGWSEIRAGLQAVGVWFVPVVALGGVRFLARAWAWTTCARHTGGDALTVPRAFGAVLAADAVGNLTPLGLLASEPTKVLLLRGVVPTGPALTSVALDNAFYTGSVVLMLAAGAWMLVRQAGLPTPVHLAAQAVLAAVVAGTLTAAWALRRRPAVLSWAAQAAARLSGRAARTPEVLARHRGALLRRGQVAGRGGRRRRRMAGALPCGGGRGSVADPVGALGRAAPRSSTRSSSNPPAGSSPSSSRSSRSGSAWTRPARRWSPARLASR